MDAFDVVDAFQRAYEARDLETIGPLFAPDASKGELVGREAILIDYQRFFENAHDISYLQPSATVEPRRDHLMVRAPFIITYRDPGDRPVEVRGIAKWKIVQRGNATLIGSLDFELDLMELP